MDSSKKTEKAADSWDQQYRQYQKTLASRFLIPTLTDWSITLQGKRLLEVGCGDGGCAAEFHRAGCLVTAVDIDDRLVNIASALNREEGLKIGTYVGDVCDPNCGGMDEGPFDIVVLRDVVEHLEELVTAFRNISARLTSDGVIFVVFPPYYSPYGAHQQILPRKTIGFVPYNKLPYIQLLPDKLFHAITKGDAKPNHEVARLRKIRLTIRKFERHTHSAGLTISRDKFYLSRPTYSLRYGVPVVGASVLGRIPLLREILVTAGYYLLRK